MSMQEGFSTRTIRGFWLFLASLIVLGVAYLTSGISVHAASETFDITPVIFDEKGEPRAIVKSVVTLTNNTNSRLNIYATVNNFDSSGGVNFVDPGNDRTQSLSSWIEITRGVIDIEAGDTRQVPFLIQVHHKALPGTYHAVIRFSRGPNRTEAEAGDNFEELMINFDVLDDGVERLQLGTFKSDRTFFSGEEASFTYFLENVGNRSVAPSGEIRIYNRKGEELATIDANLDSAALLPDATSRLTAQWDPSGKFGRFKALLDLEYGDKQQGTVHDTVFFWIIPWKFLLVVFLVLGFIVSGVTYMFYTRHRLQPIGARAYVDETIDHEIEQMESHHEPEAETTRPATPVQLGTRNIQAGPTRIGSIPQTKTAVPQMRPSQPSGHGHVVDLKKGPR